MRPLARSLSLVSPTVFCSLSRLSRRNPAAGPRSGAIARAEEGVLLAGRQARCAQPGGNTRILTFMSILAGGASVFFPWPFRLIYALLYVYNTRAAPRAIAHLTNQFPCCVLAGRRGGSLISSTNIEKSHGESIKCEEILGG